MGMRCWAMAALVAGVILVAVPGLAYAQMTPPPPPGGYGPATPETGTTTTTTKRLFTEVEGLALSPAGDDMENTKLSIGLRVAAGLRVTPGLALIAAYRYTVVKLDQNPAGVNLHFSEIAVGGRILAPAGPQMELFGEVLIMQSTFVAELDGESESDSDLGVEIGAGGSIKAGASLELFGRIGYVKPFREVEGDEIDIAWLTVGAGGRLLF